MRQVVENRWFAILDLFLVLISAAAWMVSPRFGIWFTLIAFAPWAMRILAGQFPFRRTPFDWLIAIFLLTACVSYWAAYDKSAAWIKIWLILNAVLLYYALSAQPKENLGFLSFLSFALALSLSLYFCLTYDFEGHGGRFAIWWMNHRPDLDWPPIRYDDVLGLILINAILSFYWLWNTSTKAFGSAAVGMRLLLIAGLGIVVLVFVLTVSRGIGFIGVGAVGLFVLWRAFVLARSYDLIRAVFPLLVLCFLGALVTVAYLGPAKDASNSPQSRYGMNSRAALLERSAHFLVDYPITGAGLASFPGVYSQYILIIPHFYFASSYNLFLDVAIEQGVMAGAIFVLLHIASVFLTARAIANDPLTDSRFMRWLGLSALIVTIIHGLFYDYLYSGPGTALLFYPLGMAMAGAVKQPVSTAQSFAQGSSASFWNKVIVVPLLAIVALVAVNLHKVMPLWYANLGAVQMAQAELQGFPTGKWETSEIVPRLERANTTFQSALRYQPRNLTSNYRLGLIAMLRQDFTTAVTNLEAAYQQSPNHRGLIKSLGYCYVWLGDMNKAQKLLAQIPEAQNEMKVYIWWWETQGRPDLSEKAAQAVPQLGSAAP